jgi:hypothetical protein
MSDNGKQSGSRSSGPRKFRWALSVTITRTKCGQREELFQQKQPFRAWGAHDAWKHGLFRIKAVVRKVDEVVCMKRNTRVDVSLNQLSKDGTSVESYTLDERFANRSILFQNSPSLVFKKVA